MKLFAPLLALLGGANASDSVCMKCEFVGVASSATIAETMLADGDATSVTDVIDGKNPCIHGSRSKGFDEAVKSGAIVLEAGNHCAAKFFVYHAKDINRYVYGVTREVSSSDITASQVDLAHYEGIKAWQTSMTGCGTTGSCPTTAGDTIATVPHLGEYALSEDTTNRFYNPAFTKRGVYKKLNKDNGAAAAITSSDTAEYISTNYQAYAMDGREAEPSDLTTRQTNQQPTTEAVQSTPFTLCLVCNGAQEFSAQPTTAADITDPCWNPSGSSVFKTDDVTARDINKYCVPNNGMCRTETWQYKTKNDLQTTSFWVGIERGCQTNTPSTSAGTVSDNTSGEGEAHGTNRAADSMTKFVRYYIATNTASKAKDNAKYPDAGTNTGSTVGTQPFALGNGEETTNVFAYFDASPVTTVGESTTAGTTDIQAYYKEFGYVTRQIPVNSALFGLVAGDSTGKTCFHIDTASEIEGTCGRPLIQTLTPQFMSSDGAGPPDLPTIAAAVSELECLACATPISNTNGDNNCVTAKTTQTVKCKTLACAAVVSNYKLDASDTAETYYYAKRGCAANPEDGVSTGDQAQADSYVIPKGYTGIKQTNQRVTTTKANTIQASSASIATVMDCYSCDVHMTATVAGANPSEPSYDSIKEQDTSLCWQTFPPQADSSIPATGTSGRCESSCHVSAYKYKETSGPSTNPVTTFHWHLERGCAKADAPVATGTVSSPDLFSVSITNYACDYKNGTLCNSQLESYDTTLQLKTQTVRKIQCYTCETPAGNSDPNHSCYTVPSTAKAVDCPDLSYVSCFATETAFNQSDSESVYSMTRGCSKDPSGVTSTAVEGFTNVESTTTVCTSSSCNKVNGKTGDLILSNADSSVPDQVDEVDDEAEEEAEENDVGEEAVAVDPEESGAPAVFGSALLLISLVFNQLVDSKRSSSKHFATFG